MMHGRRSILHHTTSIVASHGALIHTSIVLHPPFTDMSDKRTVVPTDFHTFFCKISITRSIDQTSMSLQTYNAHSLLYALILLTACENKCSLVWSWTIEMALLLSSTVPSTTQSIIQSDEWRAISADLIISTLLQSLQPAPYASVIKLCSHSLT